MKASEIQALLDEPACDHNKKEKSGCAKQGLDFAGFHAVLQ